MMPDPAGADLGPEPSHVPARTPHRPTVAPLAPGEDPWWAAELPRTAADYKTQPPPGGPR